MKLLGITKVTKSQKITMLAAVRKEIGVTEGDFVAFYKKGNEIIVKKGK